MEAQTVSVSLDDLAVIRAALNAAYHQNVAMDMCDQYRKLTNRQTYSALTKTLDGCLTTVENYFPQEETDEQS